MRGRRVLPLLFVVAIGAACASDDSEPDDARGDLSEAEQDYADAFAATIEDDENGFGVEAEDAQCMGDAVMAELGTAPFDEAEVEASEIRADGDSPGALLGDGAIAREQALAIVDTWEDCTDLVDLLIGSAGSDLQLDPAGEECLRDGLAEDDLAQQVLIGPFLSEDGDPDDETIAAFLALLEECGADEAGGPVVDNITESLLEGSSLTEEQARCLAQGVVDEIGLDRMGELFSGGELDELSAEGQDEVTGALLKAATECDVPLTAFG